MSPKTRFAKRALDLTVSLLGLAVLLPLLPLIALLIKLESRGPVFCKELFVGRERRASRGDDGSTRRLHDVLGMPFRLRTFRVRRLTGERTAIGGLLVGTGLERFPQLLSVLMGYMSLVGPRASSAGFLDALKRRWPTLEARVSGVKPGLIGFATRVDRGEVDEVFFNRLADRLYLDQVYCEHLSRCGGFDVLLVDLSVIVRGFFFRRAKRGKQLVKLTYPARWALAEADTQGLSEALAAQVPAHAEARVDSDSDGLSISWRQGSRPGVGWPAVDQGVNRRLAQHCDGAFLGPDELRLCFDMSIPEELRAQQGNDLIQVELPAGCGRLGELCSQLSPLWRALAGLSVHPGLEDRVQAGLLEGLTLAAARAADPAAVLKLSILLEPHQLSLAFDGRPVRVVEVRDTRPQVAAVG